MFHHVIDKAEHLEVVQEVISDVDLPVAVQRLCPDWVIVSLPISDPIRNWIHVCMQEDPSVRFIFLSPDNNGMTMKGQLPFEEDLSNLSLKEFIYLLEKNLQHT